MTILFGIVYHSLNIDDIWTFGLVRIDYNDIFQKDWNPTNSFYDNKTLKVSSKSKFIFHKQYISDLIVDFIHK